MDATPHSITYYVYALARPDGRIFYIGKGSKRRVFAHDGEARSGHKCHKCSIIRKAWRQGQDIQRYMLLTTKDEREAFAYEREMIALHGRNNLCNETDGGEGRTNAVVSSDTRKKLSAASTRMWADSKHREMIAELSKKRYADPDFRARHKEILIANLSSPAIQAKISEGLRRRWADPVARRRQSERMKGAITEEGRMRIAETTSRYWQDVEHKQRRIDAIKQASLNPEVRARRSAANHRRYANSEERRKTAEQGRKRFENPAERERARRQMAERWGYSYTLQSPDGQIYTTNNLNAFCQDHSLNSSHMRRVCIGKLKAHKGWTGTRTQSNH